uniref:Lipid membrane protein n=1 Tax=Pithovirus LCPAC104 TaxID=2506589 RepID=A0A481Z3X8_9VIRU|nr:MAG: lipid membrane protein [Pithovirus LCPAC104]
MGNAFSTNTVNDVVDILVNIVISATQNCQTTISQNQVLNISGNTGVTIDLGKIDWSQVINYNLSCISQVDTQTNIDQNLQEEIDQISSSINQAFNLSGTTEADNILNILTKLSDQIKISFNQTCKNIFQQDQVFNITGNNDSQIKTTLNFNQSVDGALQCIQEDSAVQQIKEELRQQIAQKSSVEVESLLAGFITFMIIIGIVIAFFIFRPDKSKEEKKNTGLTIVIVIIIFIIIYIILAWALGWFPFGRTRTN